MEQQINWLIKGLCKVFGLLCMGMVTTLASQSLRTLGPNLLLPSHSSPVCINYAWLWSTRTRGECQLITWAPATSKMMYLWRVLSEDSAIVSHVKGMARVKGDESVWGSHMLQHIGTGLKDLALQQLSNGENFWREQGAGRQQSPVIVYEIREAMSYMKAGIEDFKLNQRKMFEVALAGLKEMKGNEEETRYIFQQLACQDSRIDDLERNIFELMGTLDIVKGEVLKMAKMTQCSHCQEMPGEEAFPMDEAFVHQ